MFFGGEGLAIGPLAQTNAFAGDFIGISGANPFARGTHFGAAGFFLGHIALDMLRQNQMGPAAQPKFALDFNATGFQLFDLLGQCHRIDHHAIAQNTLFASANARRHQMQFKGFWADNHRMSGIIAPLIAHNIIRALREKIHDFAFAFVTPLGSHHDLHFDSVLCVSLPCQDTRIGTV